MSDYAGFWIALALFLIFHMDAGSGLSIADAIISHLTSNAQ